MARSVVDKRHYHNLAFLLSRTTVRSHNEDGERLFVPAKPRWWLHIPEIRTMLVEAEVPVVDRAAVERLFGLQRRQAIELMHRFGGYQAGRTFLIGREQLIEALDAIAASGEYQHEAARRDRLVASVDALRRTRQMEAVRIPVSREVFDTRLK